MRQFQVVRKKNSSIPTFYLVSNPSNSIDVQINPSIQISTWDHSSSGISSTYHLHLLPALGTWTSYTSVGSRCFNVKMIGQVSSKSRGLRPFTFNSTFHHIEVHHCIRQKGIKKDKLSSVIHLQQANNCKIHAW